MSVRYKIFMGVILMVLFTFLSENRSQKMIKQHNAYKLNQVDQLQYIREGLRKAHIKTLKKEPIKENNSFGYFDAMLRLHITSLKKETINE